MLTVMDMDDDLEGARQRVKISGARARQLRAQLTQLPDDSPERARIAQELQGLDQDVSAATLTLATYAELDRAAATFAEQPAQNESGE